MISRQRRASFLLCAEALICLAVAGGQQPQLRLAREIFTGVHADQHAYSASEYNQYQEAASQKDAQQRIALLDAFVAKNPASSLMPYVLNLYYRAYSELGNDRKAFEYADQFLMLGAPLGPDSRLQALYVRCKTFPEVFDPNAPDASSQLTKNRYDALEAVRLIGNLNKPSGSALSDADFLASKRGLTSQMLDVAADADVKLHDTNSAEDELRVALVNNPSDGWADYTLGVLYLKKSPPQVADGVWLMARAIPARPDAEAAIRKYLRSLIMAYQHTNCEAAAEGEMNDLIRLATATPDRPASFNLSAALSPDQERMCPAQEAAAASPTVATTQSAPPEAAKPSAPIPETRRTETGKTARPEGPGKPASREAETSIAPSTGAEAGKTPSPETAATNAPPPVASHRGLEPEEPANPAQALAPPGRYYALVIGINHYAYAPKLQTAVGDAQAIAAILRQDYGFQTRVLTDATREQIIHALGDYRHLLDENSNLLIYYAGHGIYDKDADKTYWLPADGEAHDSSNWIIADEITTDIKVIPARHILIISDSCYSGGITRSVDMAFTAQERGRYLEKMLAGKSRTLMASGGLEPVSDSGSGGHSVFAGALLRGLKAEEAPVFSAETLFEEFIRISVAGQSDQTPQYTVIRNSGHDSGDFVFFRATPGSPSR